MQILKTEPTPQPLRMSLFGDLPPPANAQTRKDDVAGEKNVPALQQQKQQQQQQQQKESTSLQKTSNLKRPKEEEEGKRTGGKDGEPQQQQRRRVRFNTMDELESNKVQTAIDKIAAHISNPAKFVKSARLAVHLLDASSINSTNAVCFFRILEASMKELGSAALPELRAGYQELFSRAGEVAEIFPLEQREQLEVWLIRCDLSNQLHTDDTFQFSRATSRIQKLISELPIATDEDEKFEARQTEAREAGAAAALDGAPATLQDGSLGADMADKAADVAADAEEDDPFGLGEIMMSKKRRREERERRRREEEEAAAREAERKLLLLHERRQALLDCVGTAAEMYRQKWAQTAIDLLVKSAYDAKERFTPKQQETLSGLWAAVREQQQRRLHARGGGAGDGKLDVTSFEKLASHYANEKMSIRKGVGGGGRSSVTWLG